MMVIRRSRGGCYKLNNAGMASAAAAAGEALVLLNFGISREERLAVAMAVQASCHAAGSICSAAVVVIVTRTGYYDQMLCTLCGSVAVLTEVRYAGFVCPSQRQNSAPCMTGCACHAGRYRVMIRHGRMTVCASRAVFSTSCVHACCLCGKPCIHQVSSAVCAVALSAGAVEVNRYCAGVSVNSGHLAVQVLGLSCPCSANSCTIC